MDRRDFLKTTGTALAASAVVPALAQTHKAPHARIVLPINRRWRYSPKATPEARERSFDDSHFASVNVPHTNLRLPWHSFDDRAYEFVSIYRRRFRMPQPARGRRVFVDFEGVMLASTVYLNGVKLGEYRGGYTPFSFELTQQIDWAGENVLAVEVDSTERPDIPPFGHEVDYLTFGGIYREVSLRLVTPTYIENIFAQPKNVLSGQPGLDVQCFLESATKTLEADFALEAALYDGEKQIAKVTQKLAAGAVPESVTLSFDALDGITLWELQSPKLYRVEVALTKNSQPIDNDARRIGFREAKFTPQGFSLNGKIVKLRGLDRHQTFPWMGQAMPGRVQRQDAVILRKKLKCNIVRTSHYPQSRHFLDACDELGLLVLEEIPGWQHIGDLAWQDVAVDNVRRMIRRDWNHPSIILWGVRINESHDNHAFYTRTNALAHQLDPTRQTGGIRNKYESELLEDVFTMNDFGFPLRAPNHPCYLNTEFIGHTYPTKTFDNVERLREHTLRHARIHNQLASNPQFAGGIGWCAFDYNTHANFGSGDRICYHGVMDIFREPKLAAGFYRSQCDPAEEVVIAPAFHWARGDENSNISDGVVCSNCETLKYYIHEKLIAEVEPDHKEFPHLKYPPFRANLAKAMEDWGDLKIEGYIGGKLSGTFTASGKAIDSRFELVADDTELMGDGADTTRVVLRVTDEYGAIRPFASEAIQLDVVGPAEILGDNPFALVGGQGAVWIRAFEVSGKVRLTAKHPYLGTKSIDIDVALAKNELL
ncbi:glycoside hydrolase family 2 TIM barrel-domain containing protein [Telmatobacter bradus]|uniref:glycoside hydrolase family 2 TIM barrel-domain containing protein n=1 Tax=Telmatobacter bradus TaxID=474953 RepID=UPI003B4344DC